MQGSSQCPAVPPRPPYNSSIATSDRALYTSSCPHSLPASSTCSRLLPTSTALTSRRSFQGSARAWSGTFFRLRTQQSRPARSRWGGAQPGGTCNRHAPTTTHTSSSDKGSVFTPFAATRLCPFLPACSSLKASSKNASPSGATRVQLLKLGAVQGIPGLSDYFVIWDFDMLPMRRIPLFYTSRSNLRPGAHEGASMLRTVVNIGGARAMGYEEAYHTLLGRECAPIKHPPTGRRLLVPFLLPLLGPAVASALPFILAQALSCVLAPCACCEHGWRVVAHSSTRRSAAAGLSTLQTAPPSWHIGL